MVKIERPFAHLAGNAQKETWVRKPIPQGRRKALLFGIPMFLGVIAGFFMGFLRPPLYESSVRIAWVKKIGEGNFYPLTSGLSSIQIAPLEVLRSPETAKRVWKRLYSSDTALSAASLAALQKRIRIQVPPGYDPTGSEVLIIRVRDHHPEKAVAAANLLAIEGAAWAREREAEDLRRYLAFLEDRLHRLEDHFQASQEKAPTGSALLQGEFARDGTRRPGPDELALYLEVLKTQAALKEAEVVWSHLRRQVEAGDFPAKMVRENPSLGLLWQRLVQLKTQLEGMGPSEGKESAKGGLKEEAARLTQIWQEQLALDLEGRKTDLVGLKARLEVLKRALKRFEGPSPEGGGMEGLKGKPSPAWKVYRSLLEERERIRFSLALGPDGHPPFIYLEKAVFPPHPVGFGPLTLWGIGSALGAALGGLLLFLNRLREGTLNSPKEVEKHLKVPVLGSLSLE